MQTLKQKLLDIGLFIDNQYLDMYINLINSYKDYEYVSNQQYQMHHIIQRAYYKHINVDVDNSCDNLVKVTYVDHVRLHAYLCFCTKSYLIWSNTAAVMSMINVGRKYCKQPDILIDYINQNIDNIQKIYEINLNFQRNKVVSQSSRAKMSQAKKGIPLSIEAKNKLHLYYQTHQHPMQGIQFTEAQRKNISIRTMQAMERPDVKAKVIAANKATALKHKQEKELQMDQTHRDNISKSMTGKSFSETHRQNLSKSRIDKALAANGNNPKARKVICIETQKVYSCIKLASEDTGFKRRHISECCRHLRSDIFGIHWEYYDTHN